MIAFDSPCHRCGSTAQLFSMDDWQKLCVDCAHGYALATGMDFMVGVLAVIIEKRDAERVPISIERPRSGHVRAGRARGRRRAA